eukprot:COSAG02_NODE_4917_length_4837_cov_1.861123_1_plen_28_part_10
MLISDFQYQLLHTIPTQPVTCEDSHQCK